MTDLIEIISRKEKIRKLHEDHLRRIAIKDDPEPFLLVNNEPAGEGYQSPLFGVYVGQSSEPVTQGENLGRIYVLADSVVKVGYLDLAYPNLKEGIPLGLESSRQNKMNAGRYLVKEILRDRRLPQFKIEWNKMDNTRAGFTHLKYCADMIHFGKEEIVHAFLEIIKERI